MRRLISVLFAIVFCITAFQSCTSREEKVGKDIRILLTYGGHGFEEELFYKMFDNLPGISYSSIKLPDSTDILKPGLEKEYDVTPAPVKTEKGYHVIMLSIVKPPMNRSFNSVKKLLENRLLRKIRREKMDEFVDGLRKEADVKIYKENLAKVQVKVSEAELAPYVPRVPKEVGPDKAAGIAPVGEKAPTGEKTP